MTQAAIDLVLQIWDDPKPGLYESKYWSFTIPEPQDDIALRFHIKPYQQPHPPIGVAGVSEKSDTLALAGARGWLPMSINLAHQRILKTHWNAVEDGAASTGRTADRSTWRIAREVYVAETSKEARQDAIDGVPSPRLHPVLPPAAPQGPGPGRPEERPGHAGQRNHRGVHGGQRLDRRQPRRGCREAQ